LHLRVYLKQSKADSNLTECLETTVAIGENERITSVSSRIEIRKTSAEQQ